MGESEATGVAAALDPVKLLEEILAVQAHLAALADGEKLSDITPQPPNLAAFITGPSSAGRAGEVRPTFVVDAGPRYSRSLQTL